jgi:hypothetical protein
MTTGSVQPLPLAGEVGPKARVRAFSSRGLPHRGNTLSPALSRKRERERTSVGAAIKLYLITV